MDERKAKEVIELEKNRQKQTYRVCKDKLKFTFILLNIY